MSESTAAQPIGIAPPLSQGVATLSVDQTVTFVQYIRHVLPLDGYVFWLRTQEIQVAGSLHVAVSERQHEDESLSVNRVTFTTTTEVQQFNEVAPNEIWIGEWRGIRFAFSQRGRYYDAAKLFHYDGEAVYPAMESQLVDVGSQLSNSTLIVSNSLPAWLSIKTYSVPWLYPSNPGITLYPSMLVPSNLRPPYGVVHIPPSGTYALSGTPLLSQNATHSQLAADTVQITLYGLTNSQALDWFDTVNQFSIDTDAIGMMSTPIMRDGKRGQVGIDVLAMMKTIEFRVSYLQTRINNLARQMIEKALLTVYPQTGVS
jgi:hypothetical protein